MRKGKSVRSVSVFDPETPQWSKDLPLNIACGNKASLEVIQMLIRKYPEALKVRNNDGHLPLHIACAKNASLEVIQFLIQQHPDALRKKDNDDNLPLHWACA